MSYKDKLKEKSLSLSEVARRAKLNRVAVHRFFNNETDDPKISTVINISKVLDLTLEETLAIRDMKRGVNNED